MNIIKKKIKHIVEDSGERLKHSAKETAKETFTLLSKDVISQLTGKEVGKEPQNFTPFNDEVRKKMGDNFASQESPELQKVREQLAGHTQPDALKEQLKQRRFDQFKQEEKRTHEELKAEEAQMKRREEEEKQQEEEQRRRQSYVPMDAPQGKAARGGLFARKKKKTQLTPENQAATGKQ